MNASPRRSVPLPAAAHGFANTDVLGPVCEVNAQCLQLLIDAARHSTVGKQGFVGELAASLHSLNAAARAGAARFPFLLADCRFRDLAWWQRIANHPTSAGSGPTWLTPFPRSAAVKLARSTLILAWHTVRTNLDAAVVLLGIAPSVAEVIATLQLQDLDRIAERQFRHVRPRWEDRPAVWRQLLVCARSGNVDTTHEFVLHALQLTAGTLLPHRESPLLQPRHSAKKAVHRK
jgi:hypothetical protein